MNLSREEPRKPELNKCVIDGRFDVFVVTKVTTLFCWIRLQINADTETTALLQQYSCNPNTSQPSTKINPRKTSCSKGFRSSYRSVVFRMLKVATVSMISYEVLEAQYQSRNEESAAQIIQCGIRRIFNNNDNNKSHLCS
jgi:hypothetical protein